jgi:hypothetical protein
MLKACGEFVQSLSKSFGQVAALYYQSTSRPRNVPFRTYFVHKKGPVSGFFKQPFSQVNSSGLPLFLRNQYPLSTLLNEAIKLNKRKAYL